MSRTGEAPAQISTLQLHYIYAHRELTDSRMPALTVENNLQESMWYDRHCVPHKS